MDTPKPSLFRTCWALFVAIWSTLIASSIVMLCVPLRIINGTGAHRVSTWWAASVCRAAGIKVEFQGAENLPPDQGYIFVANHQGVFDILVSFVALPVEFRWLAKLVLFKIPFLGWAMTRAGHLPVARGDSTQTPRLLRSAAKAIKSGTNVIIFPEGTRNRSPEKGLMAFRKGGFVLSRLAKRPVVPLALIGTDQAISVKPFRVHPMTITVRLGKPISPAAYSRKDLDGFAADTRSAVGALMNSK
jgi:1-acyl-sn-glycerol-3-phosphate acyltransferase